MNLSVIELGMGNFVFRIRLNFFNICQKNKKRKIRFGMNLSDFQNKYQLVNLSDFQNKYQLVFCFKTKH